MENRKEMMHYGTLEEPVKDKDGFIIFEMLDEEALKERFGLSKLTVLGDKLYVGCTMDEFFIEHDGEGGLVLYHKNAYKNKKSYHKEDRKFDSIFSVLGYCKHHNRKYNGLGHNNVNMCGKTRMEILFMEIEKQKNKNSINVLTA